MLAAMRGRVALFMAVSWLVVGACGGSTTAEKPPRSADSEEIADDVEQTSVPAESSKRSSAKGQEEGDNPAPPAEPEFKEGMSVTDAINAVPSGTPRVNIDQDVLGEPLKDPKTWAACKLAPGDHFQVTVAVWNGRAVGVDVEAKSKRVSDCVAQAVRAVTWRDKVKSLNNVEYSQ
jgi:hypothetical protein